MAEGTRNYTQSQAARSPHTPRDGDSPLPVPGRRTQVTWMRLCPCLREPQKTQLLVADWGWDQKLPPWQARAIVVAQGPGAIHVWLAT